MKLMAQDEVGGVCKGAWAMDEIVARTAGKRTDIPSLRLRDEMTRETAESILST